VFHGRGKIPSCGRVFHGRGKIPSCGRVFHGRGKIPSCGRVFHGRGKIPSYGRVFGLDNNVLAVAASLSTIGCDESNRELLLIQDYISIEGISTHEH